MFGPWLVNTLYHTMLSGAKVSLPKYFESMAIMGSAIVRPEINAHCIKVRQSRCRNSNSNTNGTPISAAKGQPSSAEIAVKNMARL